MKRKSINDNINIFSDMATPSNNSLKTVNINKSKTEAIPSIVNFSDAMK